MSKTTLKQKILLIIFSFILFVILLELCLRLGGFIFLSIQEYRNRLALKQKGTFRIMCLGESTTAPMGINDHSWPRQLQEILNQRNIGISFSVINEGSSGANTSVILFHLEDNLDKYKPDMVITMMGINDGEGNTPYIEPLTKTTTPFFKTLRIYKLASLLRLHIISKAAEIKTYKPKQKKKSIISKTDDLTQPASYKDQEQYSKAEEMFKKAIEIDPENAAAYTELGWYYREQEQYAQAESILKKAIEIDPENAAAYTELGWCYREQEQYAQAKSILKKAIEIDPENAAAYTELAECYKEQEQYAQAESILKNAIEIKPDVQLYTALAWCYGDQGEYAKAKEMIKKAIEIKPDAQLYIYIQLARCYERQEQYAQAESILKKAIEIDPENAAAYTQLGRRYRNQEQYPQAEEMFKKAIEIEPGYSWAYGGLAYCYQKLGEHELADEYFREAEKLISEYYNPVTCHNYQGLKEILDQRNIKLVCVQYPMRSIKLLKRMFKTIEGIIFIDNEKIFKQAVRNSSYDTYFTDIFGGNFGHCTSKGDRLLAENIANTILKEYFKID